MTGRFESESVADFSEMRNYFLKFFHGIQDVHWKPQRALRIYAMFFPVLNGFVIYEYWHWK